MEDPIRFDIYGKAHPHAVAAAAAMTLISSGAYSSEIAARKAANGSRSEGTHALVAKGIAWAECQKAMAGAEATFGEFLVMQEGYAPGEAAHFCEEHRIHHGGSLGCHVCSGFYAR